MKKIALYLDTSSLFNGGIVGLETHILSLIKLLEDNKDLELLTNDILYAEIGQNVANITLPNGLDKCLSPEDIESVNKTFEDNKKKYLALIDRLFKMGTKIDVGISNEYVVYGVNKQYRKSPPWGNKKPNEWKDFFVQCALFRHSEDRECRIIVSTRDKDFDGLIGPEMNVQKTPLKDFLPYLGLYLGEYNFKAYLSSKIYSELESAIKSEIAYHWDWPFDIPEEDPEIDIIDVEVLDASNKEKMPISVEAELFGLNEYGDDRYDDVYSKRVSKIKTYEMFCSFEGEFDPAQFVKNTKFVPDTNRVKLITNYK